jgi:hypothetical protein
MAYRDTRVVIGKDNQLEPLLCALETCTEPVTGNQEKYCSNKCCLKASAKNHMKQYKGVYRELDGWGGGPRGLTKVENSIKRSESYVTGTGKFVVDDYYVDPDIFAIAEANHEKYILDRNEYEARVVIEGLKVFKDSYNENHDIKYEKLMSEKNKAKLTEDQKIYRRNQNHKYWRKNKKKILSKASARYKANPNKYKKIRKKYYNYTKQPELFKFEKWLRKRS